MKTFKLIGCFAFALSLVCSARAMAEQATATATILAPLTITKTKDLDFGEIASTGSSHDVTVSPTGPMKGPGTSINLTAGTPAEFTITGESGHLYSVTLPGLGDVSLTGPGADMPVKDFSSDATSTLPSASFTLHVGATLTVGASQTPGSYSGDFVVTVAYN